jgi:DNA-binding Lrp family transcriptional regulator
VGLSKKLLPILMHLDSEPLLSYQELAERVGISWPTAKKRYNEAIEKKILFPPTASYHYKKIGLINVTIIAFVPKYKALKLVERACDAHPYTVYRSRLTGHQFGIFIKFYIPDQPEAVDNLMEYFDYLQNKGWITDDLIMKGSNTYHDQINIYPNLDYYDFEENLWNFSWDDWYQNMQDLANIPKIVHSESVEKIDLSELTKTRLTILNRLTKNASIKQADLMREESLNLSRTEAHRQYNYVMDNLISDIENAYDRSRFDLSDLNLFLIKNLEEETLNRIYYHLKNNPPPFRISLELLDNNSIIMWSSMNQRLAQTFGYEMWKICPQLKMYNLVYAGSNSARYMFYVDNFDFRKNNWKISKKWMISDPISIIEKNLA